MIQGQKNGLAFAACARACTESSPMRQQEHSRDAPAGKVAGRNNSGGAHEKTYLKMPFCHFGRGHASCAFAYAVVKVQEHL